MDYADPKEFLTGSPYDPVITNGINNILAKGSQLISQNKGLTSDMLYTALAPEVNKLSAASQNLKVIERQRKEAEDKIKTIRGIDQDKFNRAFKENAYYDTDEKGNKILRDLYTVDPSKDYADYTLKNSEVFNNEGFDQFAKESKTYTDVGRRKIIDPRGGYKMFKTELTAPSHLISEKDKEGNHIGFVPKYEIATDEGSDLLHQFQTEQGQPISAPIRLLDKKIFNDLPVSSKAYVRQEANKYAKLHNVPLNSVQAENFARAIAYDELNADSKKWGAEKTIEEQKAPQIKIFAPRQGNSGSGESELGLRDVYREIKDQFDKVKDPYGIPLTILSGTAQKILKQYAATEKDPKNLFLKMGNNGEIQLREYPSEDLITTIENLDVNIPAQPSVKEKRSLIQKANGAVRNVINKVTGKKKVSW